MSLCCVGNRIFPSEMTTRILIINGNPDPGDERLCAGICRAYADGAQASGHDIRRINVGALSFPLVRSADDFMAPVTETDIENAQADIQWAEHLVIVYPLWLGSQPAVFKAFLEQVFRYGFALSMTGHGFPKWLLRGRSAHIFVTMGMPGLMFRAIFGAFGERALERNILKLSGIAPIRRTVIGNVASAGVCRRAIKKARRAGLHGS